MKFLRILLLGLVLVVVLVAVVIGLAFVPGVQTWAAHKALAAQPGLGLQIDKVAAGLHLTRVENVRYTRPGLSLVLPSAEIEVALLDAARRQVAVKHVTAKDWTLDLSQPAAAPASSPATGTASSPAKPAAPAAPAPAPAEAVRQAFAGIFQQLQLPVDFSLAGLDIEGDVILPSGQGTLHVVLIGDNITAGQDGALSLEASLSSAPKDAPVSSLVLHSDLTLHMDTPRSFTHVAVVTNGTATGNQFPKGAAVHLALDAARATDGGEAYSLVFQAGKKELVNVAVQLPAGTAPLSGTWVLDFNDTDLAPFTLGLTLPAFAVAGQGTFSTDRTFAELHTAGQLNTTVDRLAALDPKFAAIGRVDFTTDFDLTRQGDSIRIDRFSSQVSGTGPVLGIDARQVFKINPATRMIEASRPADDLFGITLQGLPLAWLRPFLPGLDVTGNDLHGELAATARDGGFTLHSIAPLAVTQLNISQAGKPLVRALDVSLGLGGDYSPKGWQAELSNVTLVSGNATLLTLNARAGQLAGPDQPVKATASFEADLHGLLAQPAAPATIALSQGTARGELTASLAGKQEIALTLQLADLVTPATLRLPGVSFYLRADRDATGAIDAQAPIVVSQGGRKSDLTLGAHVTPGKASVQIDAQVSGDALYIEDLQLFSALLAPAPAAPAPSAAPASSPAPSPAAAPAPSAPAVPLWAGLTGSLKLALKKVVYSSAIQVTDIGGDVKITPAAVSLDTLKATLAGDATFKAGGILSFDTADKTTPYGLKADLAVNNFDPALTFMLLDPSKPAPVEGKFDLTTRLSGRAAAPAGFADSALGDVTVISRGGTLRVLTVKSSNTVSTVSKAAAVIGLFGALTGNSQATRLGEQSGAAAAIVQQLGTIHFDQLNIVLSRDAEHDVLIKDLTLISPQMRLAGSGKITYVPDVPLRLQPLLINLQLGARDQLADNFRQLRLLSAGGADALGYVPLSQPIQLDGTLQSIGTEQLQKLITNALTN